MGSVVVIAVQPVCRHVSDLLQGIKDVTVQHLCAVSSIKSLDISILSRLSWLNVIEGNALASPQGRAEDVFLGLRFAQGPRADINVGYRILEGGADNNDVYTFALFNHLAVGARWNF